MNCVAAFNEKSSGNPEMLELEGAETQDKGDKGFFGPVLEWAETQDKAFFKDMKKRPKVGRCKLTLSNPHSIESAQIHALETNNM